MTTNLNDIHKVVTWCILCIHGDSRVLLSMISTYHQNPGIFAAFRAPFKRWWTRRGLSSQAEVFGAIRVFRRRGGGTSRPLGIPCASRNGHLDPQKMRLIQENLVLKTKDFDESLEAKWWIKGTNKHGEKSQRHSVLFHECMDRSCKIGRWKQHNLADFSTQNGDIDQHITNEEATWFFCSKVWALAKAVFEIRPTISVQIVHEHIELTYWTLKGYSSLTQRHWMFLQCASVRAGNPETYRKLLIWTAGDWNQIVGRFSPRGRAFAHLTLKEIRQTVWPLKLIMHTRNRARSDKTVLL
jgi:hypothetical protein